MSETIDRPAGFDQRLIDMRPKLLSFALKLSRNRDEAEDLVQVAMMKAMANHQQFKPGTNMEAWVTTILKFYFLGKMRKKSHEVHDPDGILSAHIGSYGAQEWSYDLGVVQKRMRLLNTFQRRALELIGMEQMTYEEAAAALRCNVGTVKSSVSRAREFLENGDLKIEAGRVLHIFGVGTEREIEEVRRLYESGFTIKEMEPMMPDMSRQEIMLLLVQNKFRGRAQ